MTRRQLYMALATIAGHHCYDGKRFVQTKRIGGEHLKHVQRKMLVLLQKLDYQRFASDFRGVEIHRSRDEVGVPDAITQSMVEFFETVQSGVRDLPTPPPDLTGVYAWNVDGLIPLPELPPADE